MGEERDKRETSLLSAFEVVLEIVVLRLSLTLSPYPPLLYGPDTRSGRTELGSTLKHQETRDLTLSPNGPVAPHRGDVR